MLPFADRAKSRLEPKRRNDVLCCSFCGKAQYEVQRLIAGPSVYICDECVTLFRGIIALQDTNPVQGFASIARSLAAELKKLSSIPSTLSDHASVVAAELERLVTSDKPGEA